MSETAEDLIFRWLVGVGVVLVIILLLVARREPQPQPQPYAYCWSKKFDQSYPCHENPYWSADL